VVVVVLAVEMVLSSILVRKVEGLHLAIRGHSPQVYQAVCKEKGLEGLAVLGRMELLMVRVWVRLCMWVG